MFINHSACPTCRMTASSIGLSTASSTASHSRVDVRSRYQRTASRRPLQTLAATRTCRSPSCGKNPWLYSQSFSAGGRPTPPFSVAVMSTFLMISFYASFIMAARPIPTATGTSTRALQPRTRSCAQFARYNATCGSQVRSAATIQQRRSSFARDRRTRSHSPPTHAAIF